MKKNISRDEKNIADVSEVVTIFFNIFSCEQFDLYEFEADYSYCPICLRDRNALGIFIHKPFELVLN